MIEKELLKKILPKKNIELDWNTYLLYLGARAFLLYRLNYDANISELEHKLFIHTLENIEQNYADSIFAYTEPNVTRIIDKMNDLNVKLACAKIVTNLTVPSSYGSMIKITEKDITNKNNEDFLKQFP